MENAWQYAKVYAQHADAAGNPLPSYYQWADAGMRQSVAKRYPMGRDARPLYSLWDGERLGYIEARKKIYAKLYSEYVVQTGAWSVLVADYEAACRDGKKIALLDFDGDSSRRY